MVIVWVLLALLAAMAVLTWWQPIRYGATVGLTAIAPLLYLAAWPCAVVAAALGDWPAFGVALALAISHLAFTLPSMRPWSTAAPSNGPWRLTLYVHNVLYRNQDLTAVAAQIQQEAPDLIAMVELAHGNVDSLRATGVLLDYPFHAERLADGGSGCGVWSKVPMTGATFGVGPEHALFTATLHPDDQPPITVMVIHTTAPITKARSAQWAADLAVIEARVRAITGPVILAGDFNATLPMRRLRALLRSTDLRDAATTSGHGWRMTWPSGAGRLPRLMRIDHVFHSLDLTTTDYRLGSAAGSDHLPLLVRLGATQARD